MKVLILGAGNAQIDAIEYCKNKGYEVYGCSYTNQDKGIPMLDYFSQINIIDQEAVLSYSKENNIDLIYSVGSDIAMPTVNYVSEQLGLPHFVSTETATICNMKHKMRTSLGKDFKGNVPFAVASRVEQLKNYDFYPAMLKPVDAQGQRGVHKVDSYEEVKHYFEMALSYSKTGQVILEQFLDGKEVSVNGYMLDGEMVLSIISDRISFSEYPGGIIKEHILPTSYSAETQNAIKDLALRVAQKLNILNGPVYFQIKIVDNLPYLIEVTPRLDGCHMWRFIKINLGIDLLDIAFEHLINAQIENDYFNDVKDIIPTAMKLSFMCQPPETKVKTYNCDDAIFSRWYYKDGDSVRMLNGYMEKCGYNIMNL